MLRRAARPRPASAAASRQGFPTPCDAADAHDQRDRLRVLVLNECEEVFAFGFLEECKGTSLNLRLNLLNDAIGHLGSSESFKSSFA
jgi:hypothetical protein